MISSSKNKNLGKYGLRPTYQADVAAWFNREPSNPAASCALNVTISEFDCQGLEVDMPIIGWGDDIKWGGTEWIPSGSTKMIKIIESIVIVYYLPEEEMDLLYSYRR